MEDYRVELTLEEFGRLNSLYPVSEGSALIGKRAEEIVRIHFRRRDPHCAFEVPGTGPDLKVALSDGSEPLFIEVKGTASVGIAWQQLKVSSRHSWRSLTETRIPVYRVSEVFAKAPCIHVLTHGTDFTLDQEDRWTFKPIRSQDESPSVVRRGQAAPRAAEGVRESKYDSLRRYLEGQTAQEVTLAFDDASRILGFPLPPSAYKYQAFWANQTATTNRPWAKAWRQAGFEIDSVRLSSDDGWVRFRRHSARRG
jgi:hypothetical protein